MGDKTNLTSSPILPSKSNISERNTHSRLWTTEIQKVLTLVGSSPPDAVHFS